jgi:hypothetical protein
MSTMEGKKIGSATIAPSLTVCFLSKYGNYAVGLDSSPLLRVVRAFSGLQMLAKR